MGGDKVVGVASIELAILLNELLKEKRNQRSRWEALKGYVFCAIQDDGRMILW